MASLVPEGLCDAHNTMQGRPRVGQNNVNDICLDNDTGVTVEMWNMWSVEKVTEELKEKLMPMYFFVWNMKEEILLDIEETIHIDLHVLF